MAENLVQEIDSQEGLDEIVKKPNLVVIHFFAEWASECQPMNEVLETLAKEEDLKGIIFAKLPAETFPKISIQYKISAVPTFLFFLNGKQIDRLDGANAVKLTQMVKNNYEKAKTAKFAQIPVLNTNAKPAENLEHVSPQSYNQYLKKLINQSPIMLFMKGNAENPQCGFSRQAIALLKGLEADFGTFDILKDEKVRQELKVFSNWPTYPQLYINGELIGGLDIMKEMVESGDLKAMVKAKSSESGTLEERLKQLINRAPLMVFMKGDRVAPRCGFSRQLIEILNETKLAYDTFDILTDEEVRQGLKTFSNWPTYPQIYAKGNLVGGLDIIKELREGGELLAALKGE